VWNRKAGHVKAISVVISLPESLAVLRLLIDMISSYSSKYREIGREIAIQKKLPMTFEAGV